MGTVTYNISTKCDTIDELIWSISQLEKYKTNPDDPEAVVSPVSSNTAKKTSSITITVPLPYGS